MWSSAMTPPAMPCALYRRRLPSRFETIDSVTCLDPTCHETLRLISLDRSNILLPMDMFDCLGAKHTMIPYLKRTDSTAASDMHVRL